MMAVDQQYLYGDVVFRIKDSGRIEFGKVVENSEWFSYDSSDGEEEGRIKPGQILVAWHPTGVEETIQEKKIRLADRPLRTGDVVKRTIEGKDTRRGYCRDLTVTACVQVIGTKRVISDVNSDKLIPLNEFSPGDPVFLDSWVGVIRRANSRLTLRTVDGSRCVIKRHHFESDFDIYGCCDTFDHGGEYYSGQVIWGPLCGLERASWLRRSGKLKSMLGSKRQAIKITVDETETESVEVRWRSRAFSKCVVDEKDRPDSVVSGEALGRLKQFNVFDPSSLRLGDRSYYALREDDAVTTKGQWRRAQGEARGWPPTVKIALGKSSDDENDPFSRPKSDPATPSEDIDSARPTDPSDSGDRWDRWDRKGRKTVSAAPANAKGPVTLKTRSMKEKKLLRARKKPAAMAPGARLAVETVSTAGRATVVWQDGSVEAGVPASELYPVSLDDREYFPGDFVVEARVDGASGVYGVVQTAERAGRTATVQWFRAIASGGPHPAVLGREELSVYDIKPHAEFQHRQGAVVIRLAGFECEGAECWAGQVLHNSPNGTVSVRWAHGVTSACTPQELVRVRTHYGLYHSHKEEEHSGGSSSEASWETESGSRSSADVAIAEEADSGSGELLGEAAQDRDSETRRANGSASLAVAWRCYFLLSRMAKACAQFARWFFGIDDIPGMADASDSASPAGGQTEAEFQEDAVEPLGEPPGRAPAQGGEFSSVESAPDSHHFKHATFQPADPKVFFKTVRNEIQLLRTSLPAAGVWVKAFEDRLDLFSAMVRGPAGTPYEDGLFAFDFQLPPDYPRSPPACHYLSFCEERLNPNLYEDGKVCVSLLGTWRGKGTEVWTSSSNLLQVIVSVQGLILVSEPYFNEPGFERLRGSPEGRQKSQEYNETVVLNTLRGLCELALRPPPVFRAEIGRHLAENGGRLCERLGGWLDASERPPEDRRDVGHEARLPEFPLVPASKGFCLAIRKTLKTFREVVMLSTAPPRVEAT